MRRGPRVACALALAPALGALLVGAVTGVRAAAAPLPGAQAPATVPARPAQSLVMLRLAPRAGDTVRMRLEQIVELVGRPVDPASAVTAESRVTTMLEVQSHAIVEKSGAAGTVLVTQTDAVSLTGTGADPALLERTRQAMLGRRARVLLRGDGAMEVLDPAPADARAGSRLPPMPASLPPYPVAVGDTWSSAMPLPVSEAEADALTGTGGTLAVRFRLDSVTRGGDLAHVSLRGSLSRDGGADARGARYGATGRVTGSLVLDRRRGWLADSRTTFVIDALVAPASAATTTARPMKVRLKVMQRLKMM